MAAWMVAGNWKMNNTTGEAVALAKEIVAGLPDIAGRGEVVLAPSFTVLKSVHDVISGSGIALASQNIFFEDKGAYTGEISPAMLKDAGCTYAIIGHSERRKYFHETDEGVNLKAKKCLAVGLKPIVCVGETDEEREAGITEFVVGIQVKKALAGITDMADVTIAYEPVWAIGTGKNARPEDAQEVCGFAAKMAEEHFGTHPKIPVLYGGSVKESNALDLLSQHDIDGALVGGASLKVDSFLGIYENYRKISV